MALKTLSEVLNASVADHKATFAFNAHVLDMIPQLVNTAEEFQIPLIIQITEDTLQFSGISHVMNVARGAIDRSSVSIVLHYDHGKELDRIKECIDAGFSSVMFDGSTLPFNENASKTTEIVEYAHQAGVSVEAELGHVGMAHENNDDQDQVLTVPEEAQKFVSLTNVDALAVAIGTSHGIYKGPVHLDIERLKEIRKLVSVPLVLHGGSGVGQSELKEAIRHGIVKVNIASELKAPWAKAVREYLNENPKEFDPRKILAPANQAYRRAVLEKLALVGLIHK
ncbi:class II fructose-bisphosphate aldolase [Salipaludibacillus sp. HK11]|uniref:class II fructose-bisphosphate aldolase n=1 Tax=Salipaludibacillus sp. HK11 TaxID=3394320 RepID=UPI0039FD6D7C